MANTPDFLYIEPTGVIVPDTSVVLEQVQEIYQAAFGQDIKLTPDTPQGVLATADTLALTGVLKNNAGLANQINPNVAGGVFLDAIMALTGMQRTPQTQTVVTNVTVTGEASTVIPQGSQAKTAAGDIFQTLSEVTIPSGGTITVNFSSLEYGPIPCAAHELDMIVSGVLGWETVDNPIDGVLGTTTQSDQAARALRNNTLAFQGVSLPEAITSALYAVNGVTSLFFQENVDAGVEVINGISMQGHSVYACVAGGSDTDVAAALLENKSSGSGWNGGTVVSVTEPASGQIYSVKFDRPEQVGILVHVVSPNGNETNIIQAILDYAVGLIETTDQTGSSGTLPGFKVGALVSPFEIAGAIMTENPSYIITSITISKLSPVNFQPVVIPIGVNQQAFTQASYITVSSS